jgi:hypothetical protein
MPVVTEGGKGATWSSSFYEFSAPSSVNVNEAFTVSGRLAYYYGTAWHPIPNATVIISFDGTEIGRTTTNDYGSFSISVKITSSGSFTLKAYYPGGDTTWDNAYTLAPATKTQSITVVAPKVNTTLTIATDSSQYNVGQSFAVYGYLKDASGNPLVGKTISVSVDGTTVGSGSTSGAGYYQVIVGIPTAGTHTLAASFAGDSTYNPSSASKTVSIVVPPSPPPPTPTPTPVTITVVPTPTPTPVPTVTPTPTLMRYKTMISVLSVPSVVYVGQEFTVTGRLEFEDEKGMRHGLGTKRIRPIINGVQSGEVASGSEGEFSVKLKFDTPGTYTVALSYGGD